VLDYGYISKLKILAWCSDCGEFQVNIVSQMPGPHEALAIESAFATAHALSCHWGFKCFGLNSNSNVLRFRSSCLAFLETFQ